MESGKKQVFTEFERRAQLLRSYLKPDLRHNMEIIPSPFFIEIDGGTSSGKSTVIRELDKFFKREGFRVLAPQEGPAVIRHIPRDTPEYNLRTGIYSLQMFIDFSWGHLYDLVIFERGVFDPLRWMEYWKAKGLLTEEEKSIIQNFFLLNAFTKKVDAAFFLVCDPQVAFERETRFELSSKAGESTNPAAIKVASEQYRVLYERLSPAYPQLVLVDTTKLTEIEMTQHITGIALNFLEERALNSEKRG
ncbi:MAG: hypothetical protein Q7S09_05315 [bacterium]|nr:hypothetical protein [bacterium]